MRVKLVVSTLLVALAALAVLACETDSRYAACELDEEVTKQGVCTGKPSPSLGTTSCVVTSHPHCVQSICLSYFGTEPFCTQPCKTDDDCYADAFCWAFAEEEGERYCVPKFKEQQFSGK
jgi:hypothetical protein